ncbi:rubrerythrin family protein [Halonotius sp. GCM10025705]|uniref:rubrerythrin family protein n=1 Tax=Halonotius sp. GCM10025705 TaxID=3252678 RepID=UPI003607D97F
MTASDFVDSVSEANQTALSRLGSSKSLYAETNGELETEQVLHAAAIAEDAASETFAAWADDEEHAEAAELFATVADEEADHYETVVGELDDPPQAADSETPAVQSVLRAFDDTVERVGGLVGRCLVAKKSKEQYTGYFTGQADPQTASLFRGLGDDVDAQIEAAADLVDAICTTDDDRERAHEAASEAIQAAYDEYTESLEAMGVNPKPVC